MHSENNSNPKVTLIGMSAGGASVHYLTLSPLAKNLYKNAISLSGSALCWWANVPHPNQKAVHLGDNHAYILIDYLINHN